MEAMEMDARDHELLRRFGDTGCSDAFRQLVHRHAGFVLATARRQLGGFGTLAEDVAQQVWIDLARRAAGFPSGFGLPGWLYRQTCRRAANAVRGEVRRLRRETVALPTETQATDKNDRDAAAILARLSKSEADLLVARFLHGRSVREMAVEAMASEEALRKRLSRALDRAREVARGRGWSVALLAAAAVPRAEAAGADVCDRLAGKALAGGKGGPVLSAMRFFASAKWGLGIGAAAGFAMAWPMASPVPPPAGTPRARSATLPKLPPLAAVPRPPLMRINLTPPATVEEAIERLQEVERWYYLLRLRSEMLGWLSHHLPREDDAAMVREAILRLHDGKTAVFDGASRWTADGDCGAVLTGLAEARQLLRAKGLDFGDAELSLLQALVRHSMEREKKPPQETATRLAAAYPALAEPGGAVTPLTEAIVCEWLGRSPTSDALLEWLATRPAPEVDAAVDRQLPTRSDTERNIARVRRALECIHDLPPPRRPALEDGIAARLLAFQPLEKIEQQAWPDIRATLGPERLLAAYGKNLPAGFHGYRERERTTEFWSHAQKWMEAATGDERDRRFDEVLSISDRLWAHLRPGETLPTVHQLIDAVSPSRKGDAAVRFLGTLRRTSALGNGRLDVVHALVTAVDDPATRRWLLPALAQEGQPLRSEAVPDPADVQERIAEITKAVLTQ